MNTIETLIELSMLTKEDLQYELKNNKESYDKDTINYIELLIRLSEVNE